LSKRNDIIIPFGLFGDGPFLFFREHFDIFLVICQKGMISLFLLDFLGMGPFYFFENILIFFWTF
jgi:hypothetical protein